MTIAVGDTLPAATFKTMTPDGPSDVTTEELTKGRKVVIFGVPGAFTPTCHNNHLPGFLAEYDAIKAKGVDEICVVAVNDVFVMNAWSKATEADGKITFLADGSANFSRAAGLDIDASGFGMGIRSKRYAMIVDNGVVKVINIEDTPGKAVASSAEALLTSL
ncbi:peroxiredoxin [Acuticoccus sediminis]|uniref:Glutathione-dependent peroxiredoxin n=1 Tax=Acuticoccus sediminis TaxID=2184697 RepID=A0A8B2NTA9_9HYPH|nr:peroxiredoxin [Acuticoccus sediminis]RAH99499.1 peroxiredoxin [Acuticoccus sediminis]